MGDDLELVDETLALRGIAHRMSQGVEVKTRTYGLMQFYNIFRGKVSYARLRLPLQSG